MERKELYSMVDRHIKTSVKRFMDMLIIDFGLSQKDISLCLGVSCSAVCEWYSGKSMPSLQHYFGLMNLWTYTSYKFVDKKRKRGMYDE